MTKQQLIEAVQKRAIQLRAGLYISKADIEAVFTALGETAQHELSMEEGELPLPGIGKIKATVRAGRTGRNPKTGEPIQIPPMNSAKLVLCTELKRAIA